MQDPEARGVATIDVWVAPLDVPPSTLARLEGSLSGPERERVRRFRSPADARRFSAARGWLRHVLAAELATIPAAVAVSQGVGKPRLADGGDRHFNVSHAGELALIAVARGEEVGVDVEPVAHGRRWADVVDVACSPDEAAALRRLAPAERPVAFLRTWTAKEAYLKGTGTGLSVAPAGVDVGGRPGGEAGRTVAADRVEVGDRRGAGGGPAEWDDVRACSPLGTDPATPVHVAGDAEPPRWFVRWLQPAPGYVGAVAAEGDQWRARLRSTATLGVPGPVVVAARAQP